MKKNAVKIKISISNEGVISLSLDEGYTPAYTSDGHKTHIENYIRCYNQLLDKIPKTSVLNQSCYAYVTYYSPADLFSKSRGLYKMSDNDMQDYAVLVDKARRASFAAPTIHMTLGNIFEEKDENDNLKEPYKRFARYMDSSIWNYYAPIIVKDETINEGLDPNRYDFSSFLSAIHAIINNSFFETQNGLTNLYELNVTKEYADINERIFMQSKLMEISGHGKNVSPFLFHSEQKVKSAIKEKEQQKNEILNYKWRILLVDDHAEIPMRIGEKSSTIAKLDIIKRAFTELFGDNIVTTDPTNTDAKIYIEWVPNIKGAEEALKSKKYEIILLDYLLDQRQEGTGREYGYELLKEIYDKENGIKSDNSTDFDYKKGPDNRFYFMFISAFTTAVSERLLTEGWHRSEDYWYIGEGACPVNTPYLFQYRLLHIMEKRMKDMGLSKILGINSNDFEKSYIKEKIIDVIYDDRTSMRQNANNRFNEVLSVLYNYKNLLVDTHNTSNPFDSPESTLATDIVMKNAYIGGFLEHLTQLVYLTAFGTIRQWPEMWEEYQFLKSVVGKRIEPIEKYIFNLKNNSVD